MRCQDKAGLMCQGARQCKYRTLLSFCCSLHLRLACSVRHPLFFAFVLGLQRPTGTVIPWRSVNQHIIFSVLKLVVLSSFFDRSQRRELPHNLNTCPAALECLNAFLIFVVFFQLYNLLDMKRNTCYLLLYMLLRKVFPYLLPCLLCCNKILAQVKMSSVYSARAQRT